MNRTLRLFLAFVLFASSSVSNRALAREGEAPTQAESSSRKTAEQLLSLILAEPPPVGTVSEFFEENENNPSENAYYSQIIEETPALRDRAQQGGSYRSEWLHQLQSDLKTEDGLFIVSPYYETLLWLATIKNTDDARRDRPLTEERARTEALYSTVVRFHLRPETSISDLERQQYGSHENQTIYRFYRQKYFSFLSAERLKTVKEPPNVNLIKNELKVRALKARSENAQAAIRRFAALQRKDTIQFIADSDTNRGSRIEISASQIQAKFIPAENTNNRGSLTLLEPPGLIKRLVNNVGIESMSAQDWPAARQNYARKQPASSNFRYGLQIKTADGNYGISHANFWEFLKGTDELNDEEHGHNFFSEYAERDRILSSYLHFVDQVDDRNLDQLRVRIHEAVVNSAQFAREASISAQFLEFPKSARIGGALADLRWWGLKQNVLHWEIRDSIAASTSGHISRANRRRLKNQTLAENRSASTKVKVKQGLKLFAKNLSKFLLFTYLGTQLAYQFVYPNSLLHQSLGRLSEVHVPSIFRRSSATPIMTQDLSKPANYNLGGGGMSSAQKGPPIFNILWLDNDPQALHTNFEFFALLTPQNERAVDRAEDFEMNQARKIFGIQLDAPISLNVSTVSHAYADKNGDIPIPSDQGYWPAQISLRSNHDKLIEGVDYQVRVIGTNGIFYFHLTDSGRKFFANSTFHYKIGYRYQSMLPNNIDKVKYQKIEDPLLDTVSVMHIGDELKDIRATSLGGDLISAGEVNNSVDLNSLVATISDDGLYSMSAYYGPTSGVHNAFEPFSTFLKSDGRFHYQCTSSNILLKAILEEYKRLSPGTDFHVENVQGLVYEHGESLRAPGHMETVLFRTDVPFYHDQLDATPTQQDSSHAKSEMALAFDQAMKDLERWVKNKFESGSNSSSNTAKRPKKAVALPKIEKQDEYAVQKQTETRTKKVIAKIVTAEKVMPKHEQAYMDRPSDPSTPTGAVTSLVLAGRPVSPRQNTTLPENRILNEDAEYHVRTARYPEAKALNEDDEIIAAIVASRDRLITALKIYGSSPALATPAAYQHAVGAELATLAQMTIEYVSGKSTPEQYWQSLLAHLDRINPNQLNLPSVRQYLADEIKNYQKDLSTSQFEQQVVGEASVRFRRKIKDLEQLNPSALVIDSSSYVLSQDVQSATKQLISDLSSTRLLDRLNRGPALGLVKPCVDILNVRIRRRKL